VNLCVVAWRRLANPVHCTREPSVRLSAVDTNIVATKLAPAAPCGSAIIGTCREEMHADEAIQA